MRKTSDAVRRWRKNTKHRIVAAMGGKCCLCGYNKCNESLALHHLNPAEKEFGLGHIIGHPIAWSRIVKELRKCILICNNCHGEIHSGVSVIPNSVTKFNEQYVVYKDKSKDYVPCPICRTPMPPIKITCSRACAARKSRKVDWSSVDIVAMKNSGKSNLSIGDELGVSEAAVRKRLKKLLGNCPMV